MDTLQIAAFLGGGSLVATLVVQVLKQIWSKVSERYGALVTQVVLLVVSAGVAVGLWYFNQLPADFVQNTTIVFTGAIALYEVFYKAIVQQVLLGKKD